MIRHAKIIEDTGDNNSVQLGKTVTFKELPDGDEEQYQIVGSAEADPFEGKISNESPIAQSLLNAKLEEEIDVPLPNGSTMKVKIVSID